MPCGFGRTGETCAASVCLEHMAAHYKEAHGAAVIDKPFLAKVLDDGSKVVQMPMHCDFPNNGEGWFDSDGLRPLVYRTALGGGFALDLQRTRAGVLRFGVRQLGRIPPRHRLRLASLKVSFGPVDGTCFQYLLSRALAADERLEDDALCAGTPPAVGRVDPALLTPALVPRPDTPPPKGPWELSITVTLVFRTGATAERVDQQAGARA